MNKSCQCRLLFEKRGAGSRERLVHTTLGGGGGRESAGCGGRGRVLLLKNKVGIPGVFKNTF